MKFLTDNNLSPLLSLLLKNSGFDSVHVREYNLQKAPDYEIFLKAFEENRIIISADTDFGFILSQWEKNLPSIILFRYFSTHTDIQLKQLIDIFEKYEKELSSGCLLAVDPVRIRIKNLPF